MLLRPIFLDMLREEGFDGLSVSEESLALSLVSEAGSGSGSGSGAEELLSDSSDEVQLLSESLSESDSAEGRGLGGVKGDPGVGGAGHCTLRQHVVLLVAMYPLEQ